MRIGDRIRGIRKEHKISLTALGKLSGVQLATLSRIESNITAGTVKSHYKIAKALGATLSELYKDITFEDEK